MYHLVKLFLVEEIRLRKEFSTGLSLVFFPQMILIGALSGYLFLPLFGDAVSYGDIHMAVLGGLFVFGITMGGLAFLGKEFLERSLGPVSLLTSTPEYHPITDRRMYLAYFLHDLIFFLVLILIPMSLGLVLGSVVRPMEISRLLLITAAQWSSFALGLCISMYLSAILVNRTRSLLLLLPIPLLPLIGLQYLTSDIRAFVPPALAVDSNNPAYLIITLFLAIVFSAAGVFLFTGSFRSGRGCYGSRLRNATIISHRLSFGAPHLSLIMARDLINLYRGRAYVRILFSLLLPVIVITALAGIAGGVEEITVQFNMVFFSVMISFFTVSVYTNLTNMDYLDFDQTLPLSATDLIRAKVIEHNLISIPIGFLLLIIIAATLGRWDTLIFAVPLMLVAVPYMGLVTAYLTGLWTNSLLFNSGVFMKYMIFTVLPLISATMLSYLLNTFFWPSVIGLGIVVATGTAAIMILNRAIDRKWGKTALFSGRLDL